MTAHDRAVEAARSVLGKALPLLPIALDGLARLVVEAVEPIIRADERASEVAYLTQAEVIGKAVHDALADLRAKVEGLPVYRIDGSVRKLDVLALLDEEAQR